MVRWEVSCRILTARHKALPAVTRLMRRTLGWEGRIQRFPSNRRYFEPQIRFVRSNGGSSEIMFQKTVDGPFSHLSPSSNKGGYFRVPYLRGPYILHPCFRPLYEKSWISISNLYHCTSTKAVAELSIAGDGSSLPDNTISKFHMADCSIYRQGNSV